jgi:hypothetical protein
VSIARKNSNRKATGIHRIRLGFVRGNALARVEVNRMRRARTVNNAESNSHSQTINTIGAFARPAALPSHSETHRMFATIAARNSDPQAMALKLVIVRRSVLALRTAIQLPAANTVVKNSGPRASPLHSFAHGNVSTTQDVGHRKLPPARHVARSFSDGQRSPPSRRNGFVHMDVPSVSRL